jgi:hypothetical protein
MTDREDELQEPGEFEPEEIEAPPRPAKAPKRPGWVDEEVPVPSSRPARVPRAPVPGRHEDDGLWEHVLMTGGIVAVAVFLAAVMLPRTVPVWMITSMAATLSAVIAWVALSLSGSGSVFAYLAAWGTVLTGWLTAARVAGPWHSAVVFGLILPVTALMPIGVTVIRKHRDRTTRVASTGIDTMHVRECRYWEGLLAKLGCPNVTVRDITLTDGGRMVHCRLRKAAEGRRISAKPDADVARQIAVQRLLRPGSVYIEPEPEGLTEADFVIHIREKTGPRLAQYIPADNSPISINDHFPVGVLDTGRPWRMRLREIVTFVCGLRGSGKSTLLNVIIAQLARMPDSLIFVIDLKGGQETMAWLLPWLQGLADKPVIDWLATTRQEADIMLDALLAAGVARAESGRYGKKLRPGVYRIDGVDEMCPGIIVICDETAEMTGHMIRDGNVSSTQLSTKLVRISERFRSVAIDPVVAAVRAVVDITGNSGIKAMSELTIGMKVRTVQDGQSIFGDDYRAAQALARLKDKGMFIPKEASQLFPPVHGYNITDGTPDDDGSPTEDLITPIAIACAARRPDPEQLIIDAMNEVRITVDGRDRGAYEARWEQEHIRGLLASWKRQAGIRDRQPPVHRDEPPALDDSDDPFAPGGFFGRQFDDVDVPDEPGYEMEPRLKRMCELLIERGPRGYQPALLEDALAAEGRDVHRATLMKWLKMAVEKGWVYRHGKERSRGVRYSWYLGEGAEFDIPGWR